MNYRYGFQTLQLANHAWEIIGIASLELVIFSPCLTPNGAYLVLQKLVMLESHVDNESNEHDNLGIST